MAPGGQDGGQRTGSNLLSIGEERERLFRGHFQYKQWFGSEFSQITAPVQSRQLKILYSKRENRNWVELPRSYGCRCAGKDQTRNGLFPGESFAFFRGNGLNLLNYSMPNIFRTEK